jgi:hypothetical protein
VVTDTRTGPKRTTELVGVRAGEVIYRTAVDCIVGGQGGCVLGSEVFVLGVDPKGGSVLRSIQSDDGRRHLDRTVPGRDVIATHDRLLVLNSFAEPGIVSLDRTGADQCVIAQTAAQEMAVAGNLIVAALRTGAAPARTVQLIDLAAGLPRWAHPAHGSIVALDGKIAIHIESLADNLVPVARDAATGEVRWRGSRPLGGDSGTFRFAGSLVAFTHGTGTTLYARGDGAFVAELLTGYAVGAHGHHLYLADLQHLFCVDAQR